MRNSRWVTVRSNPMDGSFWEFAGSYRKGHIQSSIKTDVVWLLGIAKFFPNHGPEYAFRVESQKLGVVHIYDNRRAESGAVPDANCTLFGCTQNVAATSNELSSYETIMNTT